MSTDFNSLFKVNDPLVSDFHIRVYVVDCDADRASTALVYALTNGSNGTMLRGANTANSVLRPPQKLKRGDPAILLSHGDILQFGANMEMRYKTNVSDVLLSTGLSDVRRAEERVSGSEKVPI